MGHIAVHEGTYISFYHKEYSWVRLARRFMAADQFRSLFGGRHGSFFLP